MKQRRRWKKMPGILCAFALMLSLIPSVPLRAEGLDLSETEISVETGEESAEDAEIVAAEAVQNDEKFMGTVSGSDAVDTDVPDGGGETEDTETVNYTEDSNSTEAEENEGDNGETELESTEETDKEEKEASTGTGVMENGEQSDSTDVTETGDNQKQSGNSETPDNDTSDSSAQTGAPGTENGIPDTGNEIPDSGDGVPDIEETATDIPISDPDTLTVSGNDLVNLTGISASRLPVMLLSVPAAYTDTEGNIFTYVLDDGGNATITGITVSGSSLVIPDTIAGAAVIAVSGDRACVVTNPGVRIPYLFIDCDTVGIRAFAGLDIGTLVIGGHVSRFPYYDAGTYDYVWGQFADTKIDSLVLNAVELLTGIDTPSSGEYAIVTPFSGAEVGAFEIGSGVKLIPENFLRNAALDLESLTLNTEKIGAYAFSGSNITIHELIIGTGVKTFEEYSNSLDYKHYWCQFLNARIGTLKLYAPDSALSYWQEKGLTNEVYGPFCQVQVGTLEIGGNVQTIPDYFLCGAKISLGDFTINTPKIGAFAFSGENISFDSLTIGKDVTAYPESYYSTDNSHYWNQFAKCRIGQLIYSADEAATVNTVSSMDSNIIYMYGPFENAVIGSLSITENVRRIADYLFYNASMDIDELALHAPEIGGMAFMGKNIRIGKLTISGDVATFAKAPHSNSTFSYWQQFAQTTIGEIRFLPASLGISGAGVYTAYCNGPFKDSKVGKLNISEQVEDIPAYCFKEMYLDQDALVLHAKTIGNSAFQGANISIDTLTIGAELESFGYATSGSLNYFQQFGDMKIGKLKYCPKEAQTGTACYKGVFETAQISALDIDSAVKQIPNYLFYNAKMELADFTLNVPVIGYNSFQGRNNVFHKLTIGADVATFLTASNGNSLAFNNCTIDSLAYNAVSAQLDRLVSGRYGPFGDSCTVKGLSIADTVQVIPYGCFRGARMELSELTIENAAIGYGAFSSSYIKIGTLNIGNGVSYTGVVSNQLNNFANAKIETLNYNSNSIDPAWTDKTNSYGMFANATIGQLNIGKDVEAIPAYWFYQATMKQDTLTIPCAWGYYAFYSYNKNIGTLVLNGDFEQIPCLGNSNYGFASGTIGTVVYDIPGAALSAKSSQTYGIFQSTKVTDLVIGEHVEYLDSMIFRGVEVESCTVYPVEAKDSHKAQTLTQAYLPKSENLYIRYNSDFKPYFEPKATEENWLCVDYYDKSYGEKLYDGETGEYSIEVLNTCSICGHTEHGTEELDMTYNLYLSIPLDIPLSFDSDSKAYAGSAEVYAYGQLGNAYEGIRLVADTDAESFGTASMGGNTYDVSQYLSVGFTSGETAPFDSGELSDNAGILEAGETEGLSVEQMNVSVDGIAFMQGGAGEWQIPVPVKILID